MTLSVIVTLYWVHEDDTKGAVITSTDQLLRTVLSLYMATEDLPLPTLEEVLFCDSETTSEEVG